MKCPKVEIVCGLFFVVVFFGTVLSLASGERSATPDESKSQARQSLNYTPPTDPALYVGAETCKTCHEDKFKEYEGSRHFATTLDTKRGPEWHGCEACHGPGKAHVEGGGDKSKIFTFPGVTQREASARCLACHGYGEEQGNFLRSAHWKNHVGCLDCHSVHKPVIEKAMLKEAQLTLCYTCHLEVKPDFSKPFHHRVNEGLMTCSDCHNPHGGFISHQLRSSSAQDTVCFKCHVSKAGPFAVEHAVGKTEGCVACHTPHGSVNPQLLKRSQINLLCLECHTTTVNSSAPAAPSFHNQAQKYQACTLCHAAIHGSNSDRFFFKP